MKNKLIIHEDNWCYRIAWYLAEEEDLGSFLGDGPIPKLKDLEKCKNIEDWEHERATIVAGETDGVERDTKGYFWESKARAAAALKLINLAIKDRTSRPWPKWALEAKAAGWTPPAKWTP